MAKRAVLLASTIFDDIEDDHELTLLAWLFTHANSSKEPYPWKLQDGTTVHLKRGQVFICAETYANSRKKVTARMVRDRLKRLEGRESISTSRVRKMGSLVTVLNYDHYQSFASYRAGSGTAQGGRGQENGQSVGKTNQLDNINSKDQTASAGPIGEPLEGPQFRRDFWDSYPASVNKTHATAAERVWAGLSSEDRVFAVEAAKRYAVAKANDKHILRPDNFLLGGRELWQQYLAPKTVRYSWS